MSSEHASETRLRDILAAVVALLVLGAILVPYLTQSNSRGPSRRNTCQNNQHQLALGLLNYQDAHKHYPGYANKVAARTTSYIVPLLPYEERNDIYTIWVEPDGSDAPATGAVYMNVLICPSNPPPDTTGTPLAYVINAGQADRPEGASADQIRAGGIANDLTLPDPVLIDQDYIVKHDGSMYTILVSENIQATSWALTDVEPLYTGTTFLWWNTPPAGTQDYRINVGREPAKPAPRLVDCRPSSNHPGGVVVAFCDGHVRFIAEDIDYDVYKQLMTPNGGDSGDSVNRTLLDSDF